MTVMESHPRPDRGLGEILPLPLGEIFPWGCLPQGEFLPQGARGGLVDLARPVAGLTPFGQKGFDAC